MGSSLRHTGGCSHMCKDRRTHVTMKRYTHGSPVRTLDDVDACRVHAVRHEQGTQKPTCHGYRDNVWTSGKSEPDSRQEWLLSRGPLYKVWVALGGDMCGGYAFLSPRLRRTISCRAPMVPKIASSRRAFMSSDFLNVRLLMRSKAFFP